MRIYLIDILREEWKNDDARLSGTYLNDAMNNLMETCLIMDL